jgi:hypothetical protein
MVARLALLMDALLADGLMHQLDPTVPPFPFDRAAYAHPLPRAGTAAAGEGKRAAGGVCSPWTLKSF